MMGVDETRSKSTFLKVTKLTIKISETNITKSKNTTTLSAL